MIGSASIRNKCGCEAEDSVKVHVQRWMSIIRSKMVFEAERSNAISKEENTLREHLVLNVRGNLYQRALRDNINLVNEQNNQSSRMGSIMMCFHGNQEKAREIL